MQISLFHVVIIVEIRRYKRTTHVCTYELEWITKGWIIDVIGKVRQVIDIKFHVCGSIGKKFENYFEKHPEQLKKHISNFLSHRCDCQLHVWSI